LLPAREISRTNHLARGLSRAPPLHTKVFDAAGRLRIEVRSPALVLTRVVAILWAAGWLALETSLLLDGMRNGWSPVTIVTVVWTLTGPFAFFAIVWAAIGKPEIVTLEGPTLRVWRGIGALGRTLCVDSSAVRALRIFEARHPNAADYYAIASFWDRGAGRLAFDIDGRTYAFGAALDDGDIEVVSGLIASHLPTAIAVPVDSEPDTPNSPRRRLGWAGYVTAAVLGGGLVLPGRLLISDLPICTGGALGGVYQPISGERLRGEGQIILAPIGDFPEGTAQQIAEHFRLKYHLAIQAATAMALPVGSFDVERGQVDSDVLMSALEREYPNADTVVIGLTNADMFFRHVDWRYAFSNRRAPRLAVVSPFRMDRGCLGIPLADEETRTARLRKMIGKNIGMLFYKLPLSSHPRSMLYAYIGGPQELDTIREVF
jgi:predicted Zn-dependent protease